jgi:hypothetical protein
MAANEDQASGVRARRIYRTVPEALGDDSEFQALSPGAKATWLMLRLKLGQYAINAFYVEILPRLVGLTEAEVREALNELQTPTPARPEGWIACERNLFWIIDALVDDPGFSNANHREGARRFLANLPQLRLVERFRRYYGINGKGAVRVAPDYGLDPPRDDGMGDGIPNGMGGSTQRVRTPIGKGPVISDSDPESDNETKTESELENGTTRDLAIPIEAERLPPAAIRFVERFYKRAPNERRAEVVTQLLDALYSERGAKLRKGQFVKARGSEHLSKVCDAVASAPPMKPDAAIVWVLRKLSDPELDSRGQTVTEAKSFANRQFEDELHAYRLEMRDKLAAWSQAHPDETDKIVALVDAETSTPVGEPGREVEYQARLSQAKRMAAGLPGFEDWAEGRQDRIEGVTS